MIQILELDYHAKAHSAWVGALTLTLGVAGVLVACLQIADQNRTIAAIEAQRELLVHRKHDKIQSLVPQKGSLEASVREIQEANTIIERIGVPWEQLFEAIESIQTKDVALLELNLDVQKRTLLISAEAKSLESLLDYIAALQQNPLFHDVSLQSHQFHDHDPQNPVRFVLLAGWGGLH